MSTAMVHDRMTLGGWDGEQRLPPLPLLSPLILKALVEEELERET
jgi:hypothetical protein